MKNKVLNSIFSFAVILVIALSLCFGFVSKDERITASADVPTDNLDPDITLFDIENYPTANYFDVTKITVNSSEFSIKSVSNGLVNSVVVSKSLWALRTGYAMTNVSLSTICPDLKAGETYTLSYVVSTGGNICVGSSKEVWNSGLSRVVTQDDLDSHLGFYVSAGSKTYSEIIINKGTTAYPYFPYYYSFYNAGVESGYNDGISSASYGFLYNPEVNIRFKNVGSTGENRTLNTTVSTYIDAGFSFYQFYDQALETISPYTSCDSVEITLILSKPITMQTFAFDIYTDYLSACYIDDNTDLFYSQLDHSEKPFYHVSLDDFSQLTNDSLVVQLGLEFSNGLSGLNSSIYVSDVSYDAGYHLGYDEGKDAGYDEGFNDCRENMKDSNDQAYNLGFELGVSVGKNSIDGDTLSTSLKSFVFSLFDAPVSTFTSVFDFEYEGFDLGGLVSFIFSLVVVGGVIKLVL